MTRPSQSQHRGSHTRRPVRAALACLALALGLAVPGGTGAAAAETLLHVSTLRAATSPTILPSGGPVELTLTLHNLSEKKISGAVDFWITTPWGTPLSSLPTERVKPLAPGETRELTATLEGPGQWILFQAHASFAPTVKLSKKELAAAEKQAEKAEKAEKQPDGKTGDPVANIEHTQSAPAIAVDEPRARAAFFVIPPYFALATAAVLIGLLVFLRTALHRRGPRPESAPDPERNTVELTAPEQAAA